MRMIMIMVINYNKDRGFEFSGHMIPDPQLPSNYFESTPLAMTYEIAWTDMCCFLRKLT